jgi:hypothetical protein
MFARKRADKNIDHSLLSFPGYNFEPKNKNHFVRVGMFLKAA